MAETIEVEVGDAVIEFPATMTRAEIQRVLRKKYPLGKDAIRALQDELRVDPRVQLERDERALELKEDELRADPNNPHLQRDAEFTRRSVERQRRALGVQPPPREPKPEFRAGRVDEQPAPAPGQTLAERQAARAALEAKARLNRRLIQELEEQGQEEDVIAPLRAELESLEAQIAKTGVGQAGRLVGSTIGGIAGTIGGGALGGTIGPAGMAAGALGGSAIGTGLGAMLGTKFDLARAEPVTPEEATKLIRERVVEDVLFDVAGNALFLVGGKLLKVALNPEVRAQLTREVAKAAKDEVTERAHKASVKAIDELFDVSSPATARQLQEDAADAAAREAAMPKLMDVSSGALPTPGQLTGKPSFGERVSRSLYPRLYEDAEEKLQRGAKDMLMETIQPDDQPGRVGLGQTIKSVADKVEAAVKARTGKVFEAARKAGVEVDYAPVRARIAKHLDADSMTPGGSMKPGERALLQRMLDDLDRLKAESGRGPGKGLPVTTEGSAAFISANKARMRDLTAEGAPTEQFTRILGDINGVADAQEMRALGAARDTSLRQRLLNARRDYREMMEAKFDSNVTAALGKNFEDIGSYFYAKGNVTELSDLEKLLKIAVKEKLMTHAEAEGHAANLARGFLAEAVPSIEAAAKWSESLARNPKLRETWQKLTMMSGARPDLDQGMRILEQAAKVALRRNKDLALPAAGYLGNIPQRAGVGVALGFVSLPTATVMLTADWLGKVMATASVHADKGIYRKTLMVLRAVQSGDKSLASPTIRNAVADLVRFSTSAGIPAPTQEEQE